MKFYIVIFALIISACTVLKTGGPASVKKSNERNEFKIPNYRLAIELKDVIWEDSSIVTFISIHPDYSYEDVARNEISADCGVYVNYNGPLRIGSYSKMIVSDIFDTCSFYPVKYDWKSGRSYFLIDDFNDMADSLIYFSYRVSVNRYCRSNDEIYPSSSPLLRTELVKYSDSLLRRPDKTHATRKWFSTWCGENPGYRGLRTESGHCDSGNSRR